MTGEAFPGDHFSLFGLPRGFDIDPGDLEERFRRLQRRVHPDRHAAGGESQRRAALQRAALVNEAYSTLRSPLDRARYLLELHDVGVETESNAAMSPEFLMEQMELRESMENVRSAEDPLSAAAELIERIRCDSGALVDRLAAAFAAGEPAGLQLARRHLLELHFYRRLEDEAVALEADLEDELL